MDYPDFESACPRGDDGNRVCPICRGSSFESVRSPKGRAAKGAVGVAAIVALPVLPVVAALGVAGLIGAHAFGAKQWRRCSGCKAYYKLSPGPKVAAAQFD